MGSDVCRECGGQTDEAIQPCRLCRADEGLFQRSQEQPQFDYKKILKAYIEHVGDVEGSSFLYWKGAHITPIKGLSQQEMDELVRIDQEVP